MVTRFNNDVEANKWAEHLVYEVFSKLTDKYDLAEVADQKEYYHKGDIKALDNEYQLDEYFVEVKNDSRIAGTGNVLCEERVYYKERGNTSQGNMYSDYEFYTVVSEQDSVIYVIDFEILQKNYKKGYYKIIDHKEQITFCHLCKLDQLRIWGALMYVIRYEEKDGEYFPLEVKKENTYKGLIRDAA